LWLRLWRFSPFSSFFDEQGNEVNQIDRVEDFQDPAEVFWIYPLSLPPDAATFKKRLSVYELRYASAQPLSRDRALEIRHRFGIV
jgi:hypothetical protein